VCKCTFEAKRSLFVYIYLINPTRRLLQNYLYHLQHRLVVEDPTEKVEGSIEMNPTACAHKSTHLKPIVRPTSEFHFAPLIVERKPRDVDLTGRFENARWHVQTRTVVAHHHIGRIGAVEALVGTVVHQHVRLPNAMGRYS
jgi:hypothetical protein